MTDLTTTLCERLRAITTCPVCGATRKEFETTGSRLALAIFECGADVVSVGGVFQVVLGCKSGLTYAFAKIKTEEEAKLEGAQP
jgi:hypothetical protein